MIEGLPGDGVLRRPVDVDLRPVPMPGSGLLINDFLAQRLGVVVGDRLWVEVLDGELQAVRDSGRTVDPRIHGRAGLHGA